VIARKKQASTIPPAPALPVKRAVKRKIAPVARIARIAKVAKIVMTVKIAAKKVIAAARGKLPKNNIGRNIGRKERLTLLFGAFFADNSIFLFYGKRDLSNGKNTIH
jgi:hypothetical protein